MSRPPRFRCAIYTRKSSEEGLDQQFNSLDAQREACEAYILSQAGEGWEAIKTQYDDGGFSGGSMDRPGLQKLLADVAAGKIDIIVVYKVDRLTRSLSDFAKIVDILDSNTASFVSVTQAFNTTTSMGRLTLNILLSFAQFEREVTGERIRDKFAASRKKGMWMGGNPPLGYDIKDRKLIVNKNEAKAVAYIFQRYLELESVPALTEELALDNITTKKWVTSARTIRGGTRFTRGALYHLLRNRVYIGEVTHKDQSYPGEHQAVLDRELWQQVQDLLDGNAVHHHKRSKDCQASNPLLGLLYDDRGNLMTPSYTSKSRGRYRYYVSQALLQHRKADAGSLARVPATALENIIDGLTARLLKEHLRPEFELSGSSDRHAIKREILNRVEVRAGELSLHLKPEARSRILSKTDIASLGVKVSETHKVYLVHVPIKLATRGGEKLLLDVTGASRLPTTQDQTLIKALARAWRWRTAFEDGSVKSIPELAVREGLQETYIKRLLKLAFLSPANIEAILCGNLPALPVLERYRTVDVPLSWAKQGPLTAISPRVS